MTTAQSWLLKDLVQTSSIRFVRRDSGWQYTKQKCPELMSSSETDIFNNDGSSLSWHWSLSLSLLCSFSYACLLLPSKSTQQAFIPFALKCWTWSSIIEFNGVTTTVIPGLCKLFFFWKMNGNNWNIRLFPKPVGKTQLQSFKSYTWCKVSKCSECVLNLIFQLQKTHFLRRSPYLNRARR